MHRELNSSKEITRRLVFILYLSCWITTVVLGVLGITQSNWPFLIGAALLGGIGIGLKFYGDQYLEFKRLAKSFPFGTPADEISPDMRHEIETLLHEFESPNVSWVKRQDIRNELTNLVKTQPILLEAYKKEIAGALPTLITKLNVSH